jgi:hypothetical protein
MKAQSDPTAFWQNMMRFCFSFSYHPISYCHGKGYVSLIVSVQMAKFPSS